MNEIKARIYQARPEIVLAIKVTEDNYLAFVDYATKNLIAPYSDVGVDVHNTSRRRYVRISFLGKDLPMGHGATTFSVPCYVVISKHKENHIFRVYSLSEFEASYEPTNNEVPSE